MLWGNATKHTIRLKPLGVRQLVFASVILGTMPATGSSEDATRGKHEERCCHGGGQGVLRDDAAEETAPGSRQSHQKRWGSYEGASSQESDLPEEAMALVEKAVDIVTAKGIGKQGEGSNKDYKPKEELAIR